MMRRAFDFRSLLGGIGALGGSFSLGAGYPHTIYCRASCTFSESVVPGHCRRQDTGLHETLGRIIMAIDTFPITLPLLQLWLLQGRGVCCLLLLKHRAVPKELHSDSDLIPVSLLPTMILKSSIENSLNSSVLALRNLETRTDWLQYYFNCILLHTSFYTSIQCPHMYLILK